MLWCYSYDLMMLMSVLSFCFFFYVLSFLYIGLSNRESPPLPSHWTLQNTRHRSGVSPKVYILEFWIWVDVTGV